MASAMVTRCKRRINFQDRHHIISRFFFISDFGNVTNCKKIRSGSTFRRDLIGERWYAIRGGIGVRRSESCIGPMGIGWMLQHQMVRNSSTDNKGQNLKGGGEVPVGDQRRKKVTSMEKCDPAAKGLTMPRIKAKAKKKLETQIMTRSLATKFCTRIIGVGPVLRAFASMSMLEFDQFIYLF